MTVTDIRHESKTRLLNAAQCVIRAKGYSATRIEDICETAGLTKGSFFYYFDSKEALPLSRGWSELILKITANCAENKTVSRRMMAPEHCVMSSCHQYCNESSPSIGAAVRNAHTARMQNREAGRFLRRFILDCNHSVEIDADESRSGNEARECGRRIRGSSKAFQQDSMKATISSTHNQ
jgi:AcrR family transcriptional regulator